MDGNRDDVDTHLATIIRGAGGHVRISHGPDGMLAHIHQRHQQYQHRRRRRRAALVGITAAIGIGALVTADAPDRDEPRPVTAADDTATTTNDTTSGVLRAGPECPAGIRGAAPDLIPHVGRLVRSANGSVASGAVTIDGTKVLRVSGGISHAFLYDHGERIGQGLVTNSLAALPFVFGGDDPTQMRITVPSGGVGPGRYGLSVVLTIVAVDDRSVDPPCSMTVEVSDVALA